MVTLPLGYNCLKALLVFLWDCNNSIPSVHEKSWLLSLEALWVSGQDIRANDAIKLLFHLLNCPTNLSGKAQNDKKTKRPKEKRRQKRHLLNRRPQCYLGKNKKTKLSFSQTFIRTKSNFKKLRNVDFFITGC